MLSIAEYRIKTIRAILPQVWLCVHKHVNHVNCSKEILYAIFVDYTFRSIFFEFVFAIFMRVECELRFQRCDR